MSSTTSRTVTKFQMSSSKDSPTLENNPCYSISKTKTLSSSEAEELTSDGSDFKTIVTKKTITTADGKTLTTTVTKKISSASSASFSEDFSRKLCITRQQLPTSFSRDGEIAVIEKICDIPTESKGSSPSRALQTHSVTSEPPPVIDIFMKECLDSHNKYRLKHGCPPLQLSNELCKYATEWVQQLAKEDKFQHRPNSKYGENIFMKWSSVPNYVINGIEPVESWYSEIKDHTFGQEPRSLKSGHFSQVIWKSSFELGVGQGRSKSGKIIVVANYNPAGNLLGSFIDNVPKPV